MTFPVIYLVGLFCVVGVAILHRLIQLFKHRRFAKRYLVQYQNFAQSKDYIRYKWLLRKLPKIVEEMESNSYRNYGAVADIVRNLSDSFALINHRPLDFHFEEYIGLLDRRLCQLWHPFGLMMLPVHFIFVDMFLGGLKAARIINNDTYYSLSHHKAMRIFIGISTVLNLLLIPYNIAAGWEDVVKFVSDRNIDFVNPTPVEQF